MGIRARGARWIILYCFFPLVAGQFTAVALADDPAPNEPATAESGESITDCDWCLEDARDPRWTVRVGAMLLERASPKSLPYIANAFTGATVIDPANFDFPVRGGIDVGAIRHGDAFDIGFRYFGIDEWLAGQGPVLTGPGSVFGFTGFGVLGLPVLYTDAIYGSELHSVEFNLRRNVTDNITLLAGFRYVRLKEHLGVAGDFGPGIIEFDYLSEASNHLYGGQIGADAVLWDSGRRLRIESAIKAGVFANVATSGVSFDLVGAGNIFSFAARRDHTAFVGDLNFTAVYQLTDAWAVRAGYQLLWLAGVALAPDQPTTVNLFTGSSGVDTSGSAFFHGALIGLERTW